MEHVAPHMCLRLRPHLSPSREQLRIRGSAQTSPWRQLQAQASPPPHPSFQKSADLGPGENKGAGNIILGWEPEGGG